MSTRVAYVLAPEGASHPPEMTPQEVEAGCGWEFRGEEVRKGDNYHLWVLSAPAPLEHPRTQALQTLLREACREDPRIKPIDSDYGCITEGGHYTPKVYYIPKGVELSLGTITMYTREWVPVSEEEFETHIRKVALRILLIQGFPSNPFERNG